MAADQARQAAVYNDSGQLGTQNQILASDAASFLEQPPFIQSKRWYNPAYAPNNHQLVDFRNSWLSQI